MTDYLATKLAAHEKNKCVRVGCERKPGDAHLLCDEHAEEHRERNARVMRRTRMFRKVQLWLGLEVSDGH